MTLIQLQKSLESYDFYFDRIVEIGRGGSTVVGLRLYTSPILHRKRLEIVMEVLKGTDYQAVYFPNTEFIEIHKKK